jgi:cytochrome P450
MTASPDAERVPAAMAINRFLHDLVEDKIARPGPDVLSVIVSVDEDSDRLGVSEAVAMVFLLMIAGHETTVA